jgi:hypothetical protein
MSEQKPEGTADEGTTAEVGEGTDVDASNLDVEDGAAGDRPATSDPEQFTDDSDLGGTHGGNAGGAG